MSQITVNSETSRQFAEASERIEIHDAEGRLLGVFEPGLSDADLRRYEQLLRDGFSLTISEYRHGILEVRRAMEDPNCARDWKSTEQIMAKLKSLP